jgi:predicted RNA binding protein YcfA (HicA-like mRNA interferase family)
MKSDVWEQLKNKTVSELMRALEKDGWLKDESSGSAIIYWREGSRRISLHYHPGKTYSPSTLKQILADIGWTERDLKRLKLIK